MASWGGLPLNARLRKREARLAALFAFDQVCLAEYADPAPLGLIGVDEVGRGSLVGPVVAAALCFPTVPDAATLDKLLDLDDSKAAHFTHEKRVALAEQLKAWCYWGIGEASLEEIERLNISQASLLASYRAVDSLVRQFPVCLPARHLVMMDGRMMIPGLAYPQRAVIRADSQSAAVAGASVLAKAYRDSMMMAFARDYPGYDWETNAGYPTPGHQQALESLGVTPLHRKTYKAVRRVLEEQTTIRPIP